jgi:hypothetical protein
MFRCMLSHPSKDAVITYTETCQDVTIFLCILCFNILYILCALVGNICCICKMHETQNVKVFKIFFDPSDKGCLI